MSYLKSVGTFCLIAVIIAQSQAVDYCNIEGCGTNHIGCNNNGDFAPTCEEPSVVDLNTELILKTFNEKRNEVAAGSRKLRSAARMATMQWDYELAALALLNVKTCNLAQDMCHLTEAYKFSGQNLAMMYYTGNVDRMSDDTILQERLQQWMSEEESLNMKHVAKFTNRMLQSMGTFSLIITDRNTHVGCAAVRFKNGKENRYLLACNFATNNILDHEIYKDGEVAEGCKTGTDATYTNLCSTREVY